MAIKMRETREITSGRSGARSLVAMVSVLAFLAATPWATDTGRDAQISVTEANGTYSVAATFSVTEPPAIVLQALTDYVAIPRFMPEVKTSSVLERGAYRAVVEQEAVARFMMFSRRVHLVLEVEEGRRNIRFRDRCGKSFTRYEGTWTFAERDGRTDVGYDLVAQPSFDVPGFLLKRLLKRDAAEMIERLKREINTRARPPVD
jgi:ribosome-associated toxin RatA of RatAB toxin-antitoxin module